MWEKLRNFFIVKLLKDGFKGIEKQNFMTKVLDLAYKQKLLKDNWTAFCNSTIGILDDAKDEVENAKKWG